MSLFDSTYRYGCFPGSTGGKEPACQCRRHKRHGFDPWVGKMPWRRAWQPIPVFLPGESPWTERRGAEVHRVVQSCTGLKRPNRRAGTHLQAYPQLLPCIVCLTVSLSRLGSLKAENLSHTSLNLLQHLSKQWTPAGTY